MREWAAGFVIAALLGLALRERKASRVPVEDPSDYEDYSTDSYTLELATPEGPVEFQTKFPFVGSEWGQFHQVDDDDD